MSNPEAHKITQQSDREGPTSAILNRLVPDYRHMLASLRTQKTDVPTGPFNENRHSLVKIDEALNPERSHSRKKEMRTILILRCFLPYKKMVVRDPNPENVIGLHVTLDSKSIKESIVGVFLKNLPRWYLVSSC